MGTKRVEYHQGATSDVKGAVAWYQKRSSKAALDFIAELHRATGTIRRAPECWPIGKNNTRRFLLWRFPFAVIYSDIPSKNPLIRSGPSLTVADDQSIGHVAFDMQLERQRPYQT